MPPEPHAYEISIGETLGLIESRLPSLIESIGKGSFALWLGSGVSRGRLPGLPEVVRELLDKLYMKVDTSDATCPYRAALAQVVDLAALLPAERNEVDVSRPVEEWPYLDRIVASLVGKYADVVDVRIPGQRPDHILWDLIDVAGKFGAADSEPDLEHWCVAWLMLEGVFPTVISANWDGLIESAVRGLLGAGVQSPMAVNVSSADFRKDQGRAQLLKFHGCAVLASIDEESYRKLLVGRRSQITEWPRDTDHAVIRRAMISIASTKHTLMIGLSAQDENIQQLFAAARQDLQWTWPIDPPAILFAEDQIGSDQRNILRVAYSDYDNGHEADIDAASVIRAYAKPLLSSLVLAVLESKLVVQARSVLNLAENELGMVDTGLRELRNTVASSVASPDYSRMITFITNFRRASVLARLGEDASDGGYVPISGAPVPLLAAQPETGLAGSRELAVILALLGCEQREGRVKLGVSAGEPHGAVLEVSSGGRSVRVLLAARSQAAIKMQLDGLYAEDDRNVRVIHSDPLPRERQRTPRSAPGRTGVVTTPHLSVTDLLEGVGSLGDLRKRFREEMAF